MRKCQFNTAFRETAGRKKQRRETSISQAFRFFFPLLSSCLQMETKSLINTIKKRNKNNSTSVFLWCDSERFNNWLNTAADAARQPAASCASLVKLTIGVIASVCQLLLIGRFLALWLANRPTQLFFDWGFWSNQGRVVVVAVVAFICWFPTLLSAPQQGSAGIWPTILVNVFPTGGSGDSEPTAEIKQQPCEQIRVWMDS